MIEPHMEPDVSSKVYNFDGYFIFKRKDGIIHLQFQPGFEGGVEEARQQAAVFNLLRGDKKAVILGIYQDDNSFTKEAREYVASDEVTAFIKAEAFVISGIALRILGNGYLRINKPKRPIKIFKSRGPAVHWLKQFLEE